MNNNNRNNRRRGRGNRNQGGGGAQLNRIDSRARGNAPQMLDKYKKLAQDAQHNGDRVQMEYYLQFADHYFRVIADNKARQDEQRGGNGGNGRRNDERDAGDDFEDDFDFGRRNDMPTRSPYEQPQTGGNADVSEGEPGQEGESFLSDDRQDNDRQNDRADDRGGDRGGDRPRGQRRQQQQRKPRDGERDGNRAERSEKRAERPDRSERPAADRTDKPARARKPRKPADGGEQLGIDSAILPPSIRGDDAGPNTNNGDSGTLETVE